MSGLYSTAKLAHHPEALERLRRGVGQAPLVVQLMPSNLCQQACAFCSYGSGPFSLRTRIDNPPSNLWKNQQLFASDDMLPWAKCQEALECLNGMGVKALEVTGGGEPTLYPQFKQLLGHVGRLEFALVSNGVRINEGLADLLAAIPFIWVRISIDAGSVADYQATRNAPDRHWLQAWEAVRLLAERKKHPEARVGVGYVIDRNNWQSVYDGCCRAKDNGADNIRLSLSFTPDGTRRWVDLLDHIREQVVRAKQDLQTNGFHVYDLTAERAHNVELGHQDYPFCAWKEVGCVIGADQNVYSCCSWAYSQAGLMFSIRNQDFLKGWFGQGAEWRMRHDPRRDCRIHCLYEARNIEALQLMMDADYARAQAGHAKPTHVNFV